MAIAYLKLLLIRHAQSVGNRDGRMEGQQSTALSALGLRQALRLRQRLAAGSQPACCYTSPLLRAVQTAAVIGSGCPVVYDDLLQEIGAGVLTGLTWAEAGRRYPELCQQLMSEASLVPIPGAESMVAARLRSRRWLARMFARHQPGETVWAVSHAGMMQHLIAAILGCDRTWQLAIENAARFEFWLVPTPNRRERANPERWKIVQFNRLVE